MLCFPQEEEDAVVCFGGLTFQSKSLSLTFFIHQLFSPSHCFLAPLLLFSFSCNFHLLFVLLFQTHFLALYISLLILIPLFFLILSFISLTLTPMCPHTPPLSFSYLGACPILPLSLTLSLPTTAALLPSPYLSSYPCFPSVWLEKLLWIIDWQKEEIDAVCRD